MKKTSASKRKLITILSILALLVMILPVAVIAREGMFVPKLPEQAATQASIALAGRQIDEEIGETEETGETSEDLDEDKDLTDVIESSEPEATESENKSDRAVAVEARNQQAIIWGIPAGHVNLFDKLFALTGEARESVYERFTDESTPMSVQDLMKEIKDARKENKIAGLDTANTARQKEHKNPKGD